MKKLVILSVTLFFTSSLFSAIIRLPVDQPTIQAGINARVNSDTVLVADGIPICFRASAHDVVNACFIVSNDGATGALSHFGIDPTSPECSQHLMNYPKDSKIEYLFGTGLWIGGIVGDDTLVSVGHDGWTYVQEMLPAICTEVSIETFTPGEKSDQEIIVTFSDTLVDENYYGSYNPAFDTVHTPLGLKIIQRSYVWTGNVGGEFFLFECVAKNIGIQNISNIWIGMYVDADVGNIGVNPQYFTDDLAGYLSEQNIAYIIDNDGDPISGAWDPNSSAMGAFGFKFLGSQPPVDNINFNWWISSGLASQDWGPRKAGTTEDPFRDFGTGGGLGTPAGDANKYYMLSHNERDYDQIWSAVDSSSNGWLPPNLRIGSAIADGFDTKFLYSFGPFDMDPGDSIQFFYTIAIADPVHIDPVNGNNLVSNPQTYYNNLNLDALRNIIAEAEEKYSVLCCQSRGNVDHIGFIGVLDLTYMIDDIFRGGPDAPCPSEADLNGDGKPATVEDLTYLIDYIFRGGPVPPGC